MTKLPIKVSWRGNTWEINEHSDEKVVAHRIDLPPEAYSPLYIKRESFEAAMARGAMVIVD